MPVLSRLLFDVRKYLENQAPQQRISTTQHATDPKSTVRHHSAQSNTTAASNTKPEHPNPQSQSLSRSYGSNLPTSLTYIILSTRGCSPWRPAADMGTVRHEIHTLSPGFSRADGSAPDTAGSAVLCGYNVPISGQTDSRESDPLRRKENSSRDSRRRPLVRLRCRTGPRGTTSPLPGSGILTRFPFDRMRAQARQA